MRRIVAAPILLAACAFAGAAAAGDLPAAWAIGLPHGYIVMEHQAQAIDVTDEDVARGFVEIRGGSRIVVTTRSGGAYALDFVTRASALRGVHVEVSGRKVALDAQRATLVEHDARAGRSVIAINYRFQLARGTAPGSYAWPLEIVARRALPHEIASSDERPALAAR